MNTLNFVRNTLNGNIAIFLEEYVNTKGKRVCECLPVGSAKKAYWYNFEHTVC